MKRWRPNQFWIIGTMLATAMAVGCKRGDPEGAAARTPVAPVVQPPAPVTTAPAAAQTRITDSEITGAVLAQLTSDHASKPGSITVTTTEGIVQLTGTVDNLLAKDRAGRIAEAVRGVRSVSNRIQVHPEKKPDATLAKEVEQALLYNAAADSYEVDATAQGGVVTLTGTVQSWHEKQLAERLTKGVAGVRDVRNNLLVKYTQTRTDAEVDDDVESRLRWDVLVGEGLIDVAVNDGTVKLTGAVGSAAEKSRAYNDAWVRGVQFVDVSALQVDPFVQDQDVRKFQYVRKPDGEIADALRDAALYDPRVNSFNLDITVVDGIANLKGNVDNQKARLAAEALARSTVGVKAVNNMITVRPPAPVADDILEQRIIGALALNPITDSYEIAVNVKNGEAQLSGMVDTQYERAEALDVASRVVGVTQLDNDLTVKEPTTAYVYSSYLDPYEPFVDTWYYVPTSLRTDAEIRDSIQSELLWSPFVDANEIQVSVSAGKATLTGTVDSWYEKNAATENAFEGGANVVVNDLRVEGS